MLVTLSPGKGNCEQSLNAINYASKMRQPGKGLETPREFLPSVVF